MELCQAEVCERVDEVVADIRSRYGGLPSRSDNEVWDAIWRDDAHRSMAIKGTPLMFRKVEASLQAGRPTPERELRVYLEQRGYADAARWVYVDAPAGGQVLTTSEVRLVPRMVLAPVWERAPITGVTARETPGGLREHEVAPLAGCSPPPPWVDVPAELEAWVADVNQARCVEDVAAVLWRYLHIHPFLDGNGRSGRLLANLVLVRLGYAPAILYPNDRPRYVEAFRSADHGESGPFAELVAQAVLNNLYRYFLPALMS